LNLKKDQMQHVDIKQKRKISSSMLEEKKKREIFCMNQDMQTGIWKGGILHLSNFHDN